MSDTRWCWLCRRPGRTPCDDTCPLWDEAVRDPAGIEDEDEYDAGGEMEWLHVPRTPTLSPPIALWLLASALTTDSEPGGWHGTERRDGERRARPQPRHGRRKEDRRG